MAAGYIQHAMTERENGRFAEAMVYLTLAAENSRYAVHALRQRAEIEESLGHLDDAITSLKDALHLSVGEDRTSWALYRSLGDVYLRRGEPEEAAYYFRRALKLAPHDDGLEARLARCSRQAIGSDDLVTSRVTTRFDAVY